MIDFCITLSCIFLKSMIVESLVYTFMHLLTSWYVIYYHVQSSFFLLDVYSEGLQRCKCKYEMIESYKNNHCTNATYRRRLKSIAYPNMTNHVSGNVVYHKGIILKSSYCLEIILWQAITSHLTTLDYGFTNKKSQNVYPFNFAPN